MNIMNTRKGKYSTDAKSTSSTEDITMTAYHSIKNLLFRNEIVPGQQLNSRRLGKELNMSSTPVIQALKLLHFQGLLVHIPQRGYFLEHNSKEMVRDIYNQRLILEPANLDSLLKKIKADDWQELEILVAEHEDALKSNMINMILMADMSFHIALAKIATGEIGERLIRYLFEMLYLKSRPTVLYTSPQTDFCSHHRDILHYLREGDVESAKLSLASHIREVRDLVLEDMERWEEDKMVTW